MNNYCVCPSGTTWDGTQCTPLAVPLCTATLSFPTVGTGDPCSVSASIADTSGGLCSGQTFEVKEGSTQKCSGIMSGTSGSCSFTQSASSSHTYGLYIPIGSGVPMDTKSATCGVSPCSSYTTSTACTGASCFWCASPNTPSNTCVQSAASCAAYSGSCSAYNGDAGNCNSAGGCYYCAIYSTCLSTGDTSCPGYVDCNSYTSESACKWDGGSSSSPKPACGWCPNSYNGGTSANGGTCYGASVLASKCDSCFTTGTYTTWSNSYCRDTCPYAAPSNGYSSGWCTMSNILSTGNENCAGNKFNTAMSNNGVVDCGECAINTEGKECGGTAASGSDTNCADGIDMHSYPLYCGGNIQEIL